jgi:hypothetical protein
MHGRPLVNLETGYNRMRCGDHKIFLEDVGGAVTALPYAPSIPGQRNKLAQPDGGRNIIRRIVAVLMIAAGLLAGGAAPHSLIPTSA